MKRPWYRLDASVVSRLPVNTGVFALRDTTTGTVSLHLAGGRSRFGLRGELEKVLSSNPESSFDFTYVSTNNYFTLYREIVSFPARFDQGNPFVRRDGLSAAQRGSS